MFFQKSRLLLKLGLLGTSLAFVHTAVSQSSPIPKQNQQSTIVTPDTPLQDGTFTELPNDHTLGKENAPITMIIYASITCPHCSHWFTGVWPDVKANYVDKGSVRVVYREFITAPAQLAYLGFQLANCAPEDDYFTLIEHQMKEQENTLQGVKDGNGKAVFLAIAKLAGLETEEQMNTCFDSATGRDKLQQAAQLAQAGEINSVPNFIINGKIYKGGADYLPLTKHFESLLGQSFTPMPRP